MPREGPGVAWRSYVFAWRLSDVERNHPKQLLTFPDIRREYGIGLQTLRREGARGSFAVYEAGTPCRPRVKRAEFEAWLRSTRIRPSNSRLPMTSSRAAEW